MVMNFTGIQALPQKKTLQNASKAEVNFQGKYQADTISFGMAEKVKAASKIAKDPNTKKLGQEIFNKVIDIIKDFVKFVTKLFKKPKSADPQKVFAIQMGTIEGPGGAKWFKSAMN